MDAGEIALADQVDHLLIVDKCRCGDSFCATFYAAPKPEGYYAPSDRDMALDPEEGMLILNVVDERIQCVEVPYRDETTAKLDELIP